MNADLAIQLLTGAMMIGITVLVHAMGLDIIIRRIGPAEISFKKFSRHLWQAIISSFVVLLVFAVHIIIIWLWAFLYMLYGCEPLEGFSDALYFSTVVYSTLGFGDITLGESCRMISGIEGANGFILFSWTAAFIFEIVSRIYRREAKSL